MSSSSRKVRPRGSRSASHRSFAARVFRQDRWFVRFGVAGFLCLALLGLFAAKIWTVTPPWFKTKIRISGLDYVQAAALRRSAISNAKAGRLPESVAAWRRAAANNRGDQELYRGLLRTLIESPQVRREHLPIAISEGYALLALSRTNIADVELIGSYIRRLDMFSWEISLLQPHVDELTPAGAKLYAEALFFTDNAPEYAAYWEKHKGALTNDAQAELIHTAWKSFWGPPGGFTAARRELAEARKNPDLKLLAAKLQFRVSKAIADPEGCRAALEQLAEMHADKVVDHASYWQLLIDAGRKKEAAELAHAFSNPPETTEDALRLVGALQTLGMSEYALEVMSRQLIEMRGEIQLWVGKADLLIQLQRWKELQELAVTMRADRRLGKRAAGYSYFLEGVAEQNQGNAETARVNFEKSLEDAFPFPVLAFRAATTLRSLGFPKLSADLLTKNENSFSNRADFWFQLARAAYDARDQELLERSTLRVYELAPNNILAINNYAAALLSGRSHPDEAIKLTLRVLTELPDRPDAQINHALALVINRRLGEAVDILSRFNPAGLNNTEASILHYAWFEIYVQRNQPKEAKQEAAQIERQILMPPQLRFLDENLKRFEPKPAE